MKSTGFYIENRVEGEEMWIQGYCIGSATLYMGNIATSHY